MYIVVKNQKDTRSYFQALTPHKMICGSSSFSASHGVFFSCQYMNVVRSCWVHEVLGGKNRAYLLYVIWFYPSFLAKTATLCTMIGHIFLYRLGLNLSFSRINLFWSRSHSECFHEVKVLGASGSATVIYIFSLYRFIFDSHLDILLNISA